jgi:hypothetical protein
MIQSKINLKKNDKIEIIKMQKQLEKDIHKLTKNEYNEIFNIIRNNGSKYSENSRGVYINLKYIDKDTLYKMIKFINYTKNCKKKNIDIDKKSNNKKKAYELDINKKLDRDSIYKELTRLKEKKKNKDNFSFQNFLDKLSVTNIKQFGNNDKIKYPNLKNTNIKFDGVKARLLKKCRETNKFNTNINFTLNNDSISNDESNIIESQSDNKKKNKINDISSIIKNNTAPGDNFDLENYYNSSIDF